MKSIGGGNRDIYTIRDGKSSNLYVSDQFDTFGYDTGGEKNYIGYEFDKEHLIN